ncbi:DUF3152 domain-containing protein [Streptomyces sp. SID5910]|uniref:DUF3152 domain-containing protein n=1 Tax=Streptomyces sp. SID5910 TaxID=2690312 RepID=UPI00136BFF0C|nr:DUF3152 domain-containing protein [Streptomyces sp. SID5910]MYR41839.1 DUF3152 domain-containing protein [Streptomyces sp. SID5910]
MNAHRSTSSPSAGPARRRRGGRRVRRGRGLRAPALWAGLVAAVVLLVGGLAVKESTSASGPPAAASGPVTTVEPRPSVGASSPAGPSATPGATAEDEPEDEPDAVPGGSGSPVSIPDSGPGTFTTAGGGGDRVGGSGRTLTYVVQVEDGIGLPARDVAGEVERILADERGWTADGEAGFRRVSGGASDFRVRLATAGTVDDICGQYGLDTGGEVNCNVGQDVMVNLKRWLLATPYYADDVTSYRALIVNHEVGHFLGHGHEGCPGPGRPAPVMMQQIKGLHGCTTNVWPYDEEGTRISGPAVA